MSRHVTVLAVVEVPDEFDPIDDVDDVFSGCPYPVMFGTARDGVTSEAFAAGAEIPGVILGVDFRPGSEPRS